MTTAQRTQLTFTLGNAAAGAPSTIYITTDPTVNKLVLQIAASADGVTFTPGATVPEGQASGAAGSLLYLELSALGLSAQEIQELAPSAPGWKFQAYASDNNLCMTPDGSAVTLNTGNPIEIEIDQLTIANPPSGQTVGLQVTSYRVNTVTIGSFGLPVSFKSALQQPPDGGGDLHGAIDVSVLQPGIVCSSADFPGVSNPLALVFSPGQQQRTVTAGPDTSFTVSFVYADPNQDPNGYGALTDSGTAYKFGFARGPGAASWGLTLPTDAQDPSWLLTPPDGSPIVGSGQAATVEFDISKVVTTFQPGPTVMMVTYTGVPGYADGVYTILLEKYAHAEISAFDVTPKTSILKDKVADVTLTWTVSGATDLTLGYEDVTNQPNYPTQIRGTTTWTLVATGAEPGGTPNRATMDVTANVLPVVNSFVAEPSALDADDFGRQVQLSWNVNTNDDVQLVSSVGPQDQNRYRPADTVVKTLERPEMETLVPVGDPNDVLVRRSLVISAFTPAQPISASALGTDTTFVAIAPTTGYVVVSSPSQSSITALDTLVYQPAGSVAVGSGPAGLCFSPDGSLLYAVTSGDGNVSVIRPTLGAPPQTYSMTVVAMHNVGGAPQQVATSPDGLYVYVTVDNGAQPGLLAVLKSGAGGTLTPVTTIPVGVAPRGVATSASGTHIYVANSGDATVSIIGVGKDGTHSFVGPIPKLDAQPVGVAVSRPGAGDDDNGGILLVACAGAGTVIAIDTEHYQIAQRATLQVGSAPQYIALVPGGAYAVTSNQGSGTLSLIGLGPTPGACSVVQQSIPAAAGATGIAVSPDAGLVVAACPQAKAVAVVMLEQYAEQDQPVATGGQPTNVAIAPDGSQATVWHNALTSFSIGHPSTGIYVYDMASSTIEQQLAGQPVVAFAYDQASAARAFFVTQNHPPVNADRYVTIVDTSNWTPAGSLNLTQLTDGLPIGLANSADGKTLFVLAGDPQHNFDVVALTVANGTLAAAGTVRAFTATKPTITALACSPDGKTAYALDSVDNAVAVVALGADGKYALGTPIAVGDQSAAMAVAPDGSRLFVLGRPAQNNTLTTIPLAGGGAPQTVVLPSIGYTVLNALAVSPDGTKLFATDGATAGIRVFDTASLRLIQTISWTAGIRQPMGIAVMPDGSQIFTANVNSNNLGIVQQVQPA